MHLPGSGTPECSFMLSFLDMSGKEPYAERYFVFIEEKGFKASDLASSDFYQVGLSKNGKLYLLDPECAEYKTIFHAVWDKVKISGRKLIKFFKRIK